MKTKCYFLLELRQTAQSTAEEVARKNLSFRVLTSGHCKYFTILSSVHCQYVLGVGMVFQTLMAYTCGGKVLLSFQNQAWRRQWWGLRSRMVSTKLERSLALKNPPAGCCSLIMSGTLWTNGTRSAYLLH